MDDHSFNTTKYSAPKGSYQPKPKSNSPGEFGVGLLDEDKLAKTY